MSKFRSVSTVSARTQNLSLNPQKLAGQCGKLKCCLNFEQETYEEELKTFPDTRAYLKTKMGDAFFRKMDILKGMLWYSYVEKPENFIALPKEVVIDIQQLNKENRFPDSLEEFIDSEEEVVKFDNVIGQDDVSRFDHLKPKKRKGQNRNKGRNSNSNSRNRNNQKQQTESRQKNQSPQKGENPQGNKNNRKGDGNQNNKTGNPQKRKQNQRRKPRNNPN